nr:protein fdrA [Raoultella sp. NCTC 9187]
MFALLEHEAEVYSNIHPDPALRLTDINRSVGHTFLDFGDDDFTNGRPHPMIDPTSRIQRLLQEARDPQVAVIVMDFVLGFGSHEDPAGAMLEAIKQAQAIAAADGRPLAILGYVLGTDLDTPSWNNSAAGLARRASFWPAAAAIPACWRVNLSAKERKPDEPATIQPAAERD